MIDFTTDYLGLTLMNPLVVGASPLADDIDQARRLEDAGAAAIVVHSLFAEQISAEAMARYRAVDPHVHAHVEAGSYLPDPQEYALGPDEYLAHLQRLKSSLGMPVVASLNGDSPGRWLEYASLIEQAGVDALELNIYGIPARVDEDATTIERRICAIVEELHKNIRLPIAVKLSAFFTAPLHLGSQLCDAGADGLVLFNRFYEPDIDVDALETVPRLMLSSSAELPLRLRWLAVLSAELPCSLAITGGVHMPLDAIKSIMCGAHAVQMVSALLRHGPVHLATVLHGMSEWLVEHEYRSLDELRGSMNARRCPDPTALTRGNYIHTLQSWRA